MPKKNASKNTKQKFGDSDSCYRRLFETAQDAILIVDADTAKIIVANPFAQKLLGYSKNQMASKQIFKISPLKKIIPDKKTFEELVKKKYFRYDSLALEVKDEKIIYVEFIANVCEAVGGKIVQFNIRDITKRRRAEKILKRNEVDKMKTEFVSLASHQLRTPLSAINWCLEILLGGKGGRLKPEQQQYLEEVHRGSRRMTDLVNALLNVFRLEMDIWDIEPKLTDIKKIADNVLNDEIFTVIQNKKIKLQKKYGKNIPLLNVDSELMRILFQNLFSNAVKYTPTGGKVNISMTKREKDILIKVSDTGYGIPKKQQSEIFNKMFRADNIARRDTDGTGLGLYIAKYIVKQAGGKIWFESKEDKGSNFYVTIPLKGMKKRKGNGQLSAEKGLVFNI